MTGMEEAKKVLGLVEGYELVTSQPLEEIQSQGYVYFHKKSGARVVVVSNEDDNKVFSIGFRTPPTDSTGVAHILEHSVLCGSKKYPAKDPFVELAKGSLNTFLNAMTYPDKTVYPIASCNDKDFQNLMNVYLDAVFYPNIYERKEIFMQEGWHYELENVDGPITYNGVVYNEMKGVFSSPEQILYRNIQHSLFPDVSYGTESGGDPEYIIDLTYEDFLAFHGKYYHPANSYIYLYGDLDVQEKLNWLDKEYLSSFDKIEVDSAIKEQTAFQKPVEMDYMYPVSENESLEENTYLSYNMVIGTSLDKELCFAFEILDYVLLGSAGAPVKKALVEAGLAKDILGGYDADIYQPYFAIIAKNTDMDKKEDFIRVFKETLMDIIENGVDEKALKAAINRYEFKHREADYDRYPKGLIYGLDMFNSWLYDETQPFMRMNVNDTYQALKDKIKTGYYEELIRTYMLDNTHVSIVTISPKQGLTKEMEQETANKLQAYKETLTKEELEGLVESTKALKEYQDEPSTMEELATIPMLERSDIKKEAYKPVNEVRDWNGIPVVYHDIYTNGIGYFEFLFDLKDVPKTMIPYLGIFSVALGYFNTDKYTYTDLDNEINMVTGGVEASPIIMTKKDGVTSKSYLRIAVRALYDNMEKVSELLEEFMFHAHYGDEKRLKEVIQQTISRVNMRITSSGHVAAAKRALSYISDKGMFNELTSGVAYFDFLKDLDKNFETKQEVVSEVFHQLTKVLFTKENLLINVTGDEAGYRYMKNEMGRLADGLPEKEEFDVDIMSKYSLLEDTDYATGTGYFIEKKNEGIKTADKIQYVSRAGDFLKDGHRYQGTLHVLKIILSYDYLWTNIRVKGGAYGAMCSFQRDGSGYFTSYRDPNLAETNQAYDEVVEYIRNFEADEDAMTKYIIGAISGIDTPLSPYARGQRDFSVYFTELTTEEIQSERNQILNATQSDIHELAELVNSILKENNLCVIGNESKIEENKELFLKMKDLK